ncbi:MAG: DUF2089 domain-containing protein [bacterium]|nr:DUF2089 domain-containing protein [bacterium]
MTADEKKKILNMLAEGKITADEALNLLNALGDDLREEAGARPKTLKVKVFKQDCEEPDIDIGVPLNIARWAMKFIPRDADITINDQDFDFGEIKDMMDGDIPQDICVIDHEEGKVTVRLEEEE